MEGLPFLRRAQAALLAVGCAFSWFTLVIDYQQFFAAGGRVLQLSGCAVTNPAATPCLYGALAFLTAFVWSLALLRHPVEEGFGSQKGLTWLLGAGALFAWGNFAYLAYVFLNARPRSALSCPPGEAAVNPIGAPCFYGALIFTAALVVAVLLLDKRSAASA